LLPERAPAELLHYNVLLERTASHTTLGSNEKLTVIIDPRSRADVVINAISVEVMGALEVTCLISGGGSSGGGRTVREQMGLNIKRKQ